MESPGQANNVSQVGGDSDMGPTCSSDAQKGTLASVSTFVWKKTILPALASKLDDSVPPVYPWCLLSCCSSTGSQSE